MFNCKDEKCDFRGLENLYEKIAEVAEAKQEVAELKRQNRFTKAAEVNLKEVVIEAQALAAKYLRV